MEEEARLPTALWVEVHLRRLGNDGIPYYILNTGAHSTGTVMLKLNGLENGVQLLVQQRDLNGKMGWMNATKDEIIDEQKADDYIKRAISRDPDVWVIEIEDRQRRNPFEGKVF
jgi:hypothetical protein